MKYINEFEGVRGIMCLWVVAGHAMACLPKLPFVPPTLANSYAVDVFIILSGFVIFFMLDNKHDNYPTYLTKRAFRIFPVYLVALFLSLLLMNVSYDVFQQFSYGDRSNVRLTIIDNFKSAPLQHILPHLLLLQGVIPSWLLPDAAYTIIGQAWSVSLEWQFYLVAPLLFYCINGLKNRKNTLTFLSFSVVLFFIGALMKNNGFLASKYHFFIIGFFSYFLYKSKLSSFESGKIFALYIMSCIFEVFLLRGAAIPLLIWGTAFYAVILKKKGESHNPITYFLDCYPIRTLGKISYSIYINHMIVLTVILWIAKSYELNMSGISYVLLPVTVILASVLFSLLTYNVIEKPMIKLGKHLSGKRKASLNVEAG